jgi:hypothetical protein
MTTRSSKNSRDRQIIGFEFQEGTPYFNLREGPSESRDLAQEYPEIVQRIPDLYTHRPKRGIGPASGLEAEIG